MSTCFLEQEFFLNNSSASNQIITFKNPVSEYIPKIICSNRNSFCYFSCLKDKEKYSISVPENNLPMKMTANIIRIPFRKDLMYRCTYKVQNLSYNTVH